MKYRLFMYSGKPGVQITWLQPNMPETEALRNLGNELHREGFDVKYVGPSSEGPSIVIQTPERPKLSTYLDSKTEYQPLVVKNIGIL